MPPPLDLQSELFSATGGAAAEGVSNQLGRPRADRFTLLVREAVQNSWDARQSLAGGVRFQVDGYFLAKDVRLALADQVFAAIPHMVDVRARLLDEDEFPILAVSDFGTRGLGGPTRGDVVPRSGEPTNFVDFMRYIGRAPNRAYAGGTYGFGKAAYFLASSLKTICVHTRFNDGTAVKSRFMAAALGPQFETGGTTGRRFTGRHWWGQAAEGEMVDPVVGEQADRLAQILGGIERGPNATGTTVYVLAPDFQGSDPKTVLTDMGHTVMDYFWPKLVDGPDQRPSMSFNIRWQGEEVLAPLDEPIFALLAETFTAAVSKQNIGGATAQAVMAQRPRRLLGHVSLARKLSTADPASLETDLEDLESGGYRRALKRPLHHIAVMRAPNFIVKYLEGPPVPYELAEYAGVFRVDADVDAAFARAEPPTHDDWVPDLLEDATEKTYVRVAQRRLRELVEAFALPNAIETAHGEIHSVAGFSRLLGGLIPALHDGGDNPNRPNPTPSGAGGRPGGTGGMAAATQVTFIAEPRTELVDGIPAMLANFEVIGPDAEPTLISVISRVVVADGFETDPPEGSQLPRVLKWQAPGGQAVSVGEASCTIPAGSGAWEVAVSIPPDAMISVTLKAERVARR